MSTGVLTRDTQSLTPTGFMIDTLSPVLGLVDPCDVRVGALRGVRAIRLSVLTDETTSPPRQRESDDRAAEALNIQFIGEALDLDVSASKTSPFDRPQLGSWLTRPDEFDVIVWWRFDRAVRSQGDMHELAQWAAKHKKMLVFAEGIGGGRQVFDFRNPMDPVSRMMLNQFAFAAEMEAWAIKERVSSAQAAMRMMPLRWRGARPPYGYMPVPLEGGGWTLVPDPDAVKVIERIVRRLFEGATVSAITAELNADNELAPRDYWADKKGRDLGGRTGGAKGEPGVTRERFKWTPSTITRILRGYTLLGWKTHNGKPIRHTNGEPVIFTNAPILEREVYDAIGALLDSRTVANPDRKDTDALLLRVMHCESCERRMYMVKPPKNGSYEYTRYRCNNVTNGGTCEAPASIRGDWAEAFAEREFLRLVGGIEIKTVRVIPGYDPAPEIAATTEEYKEHQAQKGRQKSNAARQAWQEHADALDARLAELESRTEVEATRELIGTGRTFADEWTAADTAARRAMLIDAGARLTVQRGARGGLRLLDESRMTFTIRGELDPAIEELAGVAERPEAPTIGRIRLGDTAAETTPELVPVAA